MRQKDARCAEYAKEKIIVMGLDNVSNSVTVYEFSELFGELGSVSFVVTDET
ncbi:MULTISPECIES: hypothetical protein [Paenibacillus]|uniref:hypothetical protein n=1 Tax=Paenibacillus TaxID=44249 RepID=UPI0004AE2865|nr:MULTISPECIES: hypothetical protein [Paenibacillus]